ncbi:MAG: hypothetical protein HQK96_16305 [Nitrospirae bacterium]|nr:hypothetical protein [Nitrospirota bacterium]
MTEIIPKGILYNMEVKLLEIVDQYGPFPVGIFIGIWIKRWSMDKYFKSSEREKGALYNQIKELYVTIKSKDDRIDKLHNTISTLSKNRKKEARQ